MCWPTAWLPLVVATELVISKSSYDIQSFLDTCVRCPTRSITRAFGSSFLRLPCQDLQGASSPGTRGGCHHRYPCESSGLESFLFTGDIRVTIGMDSGVIGEQDIGSSRWDALESPSNWSFLGSKACYIHLGSDSTMCRRRSRMGGCIALSPSSCWLGSVCNRSATSRDLRRPLDVVISV